MPPTAESTLPFVECDAVVRQRQLAMKLCRADLPIIVAGEQGTGRRMLARELATQRAGRSSVPLQECFGGGDDIAELQSRADGRVAHLLITEMHLLEQRQLEWIWNGVTARKLVVCGTSVPGAFDAERVCFGVEQVELPPLRERSDVLEWATYFLAELSGRSGLSRRFGAGAAERLRAYAWPGNLTQLRAVVERAHVVAASDEIAAAELGTAVASSDVPALRPLKEAVDDFKATYIRQALTRFGGNRTQTARALGVDARTIFRYVAKGT